MWSREDGVIEIMCSTVLYTHDIEEIEMDLTGTCNLKCPLCTRNYVHA